MPTFTITEVRALIIIISLLILSGLTFFFRPGPYLKEAIAMGGGSCPGFEGDVASGAL